MTDLIEYVKTKEFGTDSNAEPFPEGITPLDLSETDVEEVTIKDVQTGADKLRYVITYKEKSYWAGNQIMSQIKELTEQEKTQVNVLRKGTGMKTVYIVTSD
jgi:hypothetical protein